MSGTYTLTFGDCAENHKGMEIIGNPSVNGCDLPKLQQIQSFFEEQGKKCKLIHLNTLLPPNTGAKDAYVLIIRKGLSNADEILQECASLDMDKQALMYGRVVNKKARHNLCISDYTQEPNIAEGKGRVVSFSDVPEINKVRTVLNQFLPGLQCEINHYYNTDKCYIGYHGDTERKIVVGARVGESFPLWYKWYINHVDIGNTYKLNLNHGDMYVMSEKAVGFDWKQSSKYTLRHAAFKQGT